MLVLPELGRDGDQNAANGFLNHRSGDPSCRNMWLLAMGAGVPRGETERPVYHIDVAATAARVARRQGRRDGGRAHARAVALMAASIPKVSPALQALLDKGLLDRLPVSFAAFCFDQMKEWDLLFPAERGYYERLFGLLDRSDAAAVEELFGPLREIEARMGVNEKTFPQRPVLAGAGGFSQPQSALFRVARGRRRRSSRRLDPLLDAEIARKGHARLVIVVAPAQLPADPEPDVAAPCRSRKARGARSARARLRTFCRCC